MTRITINLPLVDARACTGCPFVERGFHKTMCRAFRTKRGAWPKVLGMRRIGEDLQFVRLPECLAAEVEEVER